MSYPDQSLTPRELDADEITASAELGATTTGSLIAPSLSETPSGGVPRVLREWSRYEVLELLGAGGMGAVYKGRLL